MSSAPAGIANDHENEDRPVRRVPIGLIDVPDNWRTVKDEKVSALSDSIGRQGLLQPIGVWPKEGGRYRLTFGRHRLVACEGLGWTTIDARFLEFACDEQRQLATDAENVYRSPLGAAEELLALKRLKDAYVQANPEATKDCVQVRREQGENRDRRERGEAPKPVAKHEKPKRFDQAVAERTGQDESGIRRKTKTADRLGAESLDLLTALNVSHSDLKRLAEIDDDDSRRFAVNGVLAGMDIDTAIAEGSALAHGDDVTVEEVKADEDVEPEKGEDELSDDDWLKQICGKVLAGLKFTHAYRRDALLYRHTREARAKLRNVARKPLGLSRVKNNGGFARLMIHFLFVDHPANWLVCAECRGTGMHGDKGKCGACKGDAFVTTQEKGAR
jgi:ParB family chromosome partitioning protein